MALSSRGGSVYHSKSRVAVQLSVMITCRAVGGLSMHHSTVAWRAGSQTEALTACRARDCGRIGREREEAGTRNTCSLRMALRLFPAIVPVLWFAKNPLLTYLCTYLPCSSLSPTPSPAPSPSLSHSHSLRVRKRGCAKANGRR